MVNDKGRSRRGLGNPESQQSQTGFSRAKRLCDIAKEEQRISPANGATEPFPAVRVGRRAHKTHFWKQQVLLPSVSSVLLLSAGGTQQDARTSRPGFGTGAGGSGQVNSGQGEGCPALRPRTVSGAGRQRPTLRGRVISRGHYRGAWWSITEARRVPRPIKIILSWTFMHTLRQGRGGTWEALTCSQTFVVPIN